MTQRAPKQWSVTKTEAVASLKQLEPKSGVHIVIRSFLCTFTTARFTWEKHTRINPLRGLTDDSEAVPDARRQSAAQKETQFNHVGTNR